jgi:hypothetical protein
MAFIFNKFDESEEEFDAEQERYDMLRQKLFQGQSLKYDDLEELMTAAKEKNDKKVIMTLKNVVTDPEEQAADTEESTPEDMMADLMESGKIDNEASDEDDFFDIDYFDTTDARGETEFGTGLTKVIMQIEDKNILIADEIDQDSEGQSIILKYDSIGWYEGQGWAENIKSDIVFDLNKLADKYRKFTNSNFLFKYNPASIKQALDNAAAKIKDENEDVIYKK